MVNKTKANIKSHEYETTRIKFELDKMNVMDKIEWHKKIVNVVSRDLIQATTNVKKMRGLVTKLENKLNQEKNIDRARLVRIHDLMQRVIILGEYPNNKDIVNVRKLGVLV
jgi:phosphotransferase system IIB component